MNGTAGETPENRLKRLRMRSWRRGTKEMDLILGPYSDEKLASLPEESLNEYELLLAENDQDLYQWVSGQIEIPAGHLAILQRIRTYHRMF